MKAVAEKMQKASAAIEGRERGAELPSGNGDGQHQTDTRVS